MERVLGGVRDDESAPHTDVVKMDVKPWLAGTTASVVQLTVLGSAHEDYVPREKREDED